MIFKSYKINLAIRLLLILTNSLALSYYLLNTSWYIISINLGLILLIQVFLMYRYLSKIGTDLTNFFNSLKHDDSGLVWDRAKDNNLFAEVYLYMDILNESIRDIKIEKQHQDHYFSILAEHVSLGLIIFDKNGNVELINKAVKNLLDIEYLNNINSLNKLMSGFSNILDKIGASDQKLLTLNTQRETKQILVLAAEFKILGQKKKLISLQNIKNELDEKEMLSWQKLSRVLTHEIMNSIAPISSTIKEITRMMKETDIIQKAEDKDSVSLFDKTMEGLEIIDERTNGLLDFVTTYRKINAVPDPKIARVNIKSMFNGIVKLVKEENKAKNIHLSVIIDENINIDADVKLIEQIILNLINNSVDALEEEENKEIILRLIKLPDGGASIEIEDNGCGIPPNIVDQIFVPFFTTREKGSGIGLSLSRQIMHLHGGSISVQSEHGKGTIISLMF